LVCNSFLFFREFHNQSSLGLNGTTNTDNCHLLLLLLLLLFFFFFLLLLFLLFFHSLSMIF